MVTDAIHLLQAYPFGLFDLYLFLLPFDCLEGGIFEHDTVRPGFDKLADNFLSAFQLGLDEAGRVRPMSR